MQLDLSAALLGAYFLLKMQFILPYALCYVVVKKLIPVSQRKYKNIDMVAYQ